ncbi:MAG: hypothetical protein ABI266_08655, partial [Ginsengibacter sp.]
MEETNFVLLWKEQYEKIDKSLAINKKLLKEVINLKAESALQSLIRLKTVGIVAVVIYLVILGMVLFYAITHYSSAANYFIISVGVIFIINLKALYDYIKHLVWTNEINYDGSVTEIQQRLSKLQLSILQHSRTMVLSFPFYTTFYLSDAWFPQDIGWGYILFQIFMTGSFTCLAYWLYKNQTIANIDKKWL